MANLNANIIISGNRKNSIIGVDINIPNASAEYFTMPIIKSFIMLIRCLKTQYLIVFPI